jgi:hypothetical protein
MPLAIGVCSVNSFGNEGIAVIAGSVEHSQSLQALNLASKFP